MKNTAVTFKLLWIIAVIFIGYGQLSAQTDTTTIKKSPEKVLIDGVVYYVHFVEKGQTLYSIAKAYGLTVEQIREENPSVAVVLTIGQALKIPEIKAIPADQVAKVFPQKYYYHEVAKGETTYSISKKYNVDLQEIYSLNPGTDTLISIGQVLKIPKIDENYTKRNYFEEDYGYFYYRVHRKDNLYRLAKNYNTTQEKIVEANPFLKDGLKTGQLIRIPKAILSEVVEEEIIEDTVLIDTTNHYYAEFGIELCDSLKKASTNDSIRLAVLLPLNSDFIYQVYLRDTVDRDGERFDEAERVKKLRIRSAFFMEFYQGVLLAADQLKAKGYAIDIELIDTERDTTKLGRIINELKHFAPDFIIGPVYPEIFETVATFAQEIQVPIISPFLTDIQQIETNPYIFQMMPGDSIKNYHFANFINSGSQSNVRYLFHNGDSSYQSSVALVTRMLHKTWTGTDSLIVIPIAFDIKNATHIDTLFSKEQENEVIIVTKDLTFANNVISKLNTLNTLYTIRVYGSSEWQREESVDLDFKHNSQLAIYSPFYFNIKDTYTLQVLKAFNAKFGYIPERISRQGYTFGLYGYDITTLFIQALADYGDECYRCKDYFTTNYSLSNYKFVRNSPTSGFVNSSIYIVRFEKDFNISIMYFNSGKATHRTVQDRITNYSFD